MYAGMRAGRNRAEVMEPSIQGCLDGVLDPPDVDEHDGSGDTRHLPAKVPGLRHLAGEETHTSSVPWAAVRWKAWRRMVARVAGR